MTNKRPSAGFLYDAALLLVCLALLSSCIASGLLAKFTSAGNDADRGRVAQWTARASAGSLLEILPSGDGILTYPITITRNSESASTCDVTIVFDEDMSAIIENPHIGSVTPVEGASFTDTLTFRRVSTFPATRGTTVVDTIDLILQVRASYMSLITDAIDDYDNDIINGSVANVPFVVTVNVEQID